MAPARSRRSGAETAKAVPPSALQTKYHECLGARPSPVEAALAPSFVFPTSREFESVLLHLRVAGPPREPRIEFVANSFASFDPSRITINARQVAPNKAVMSAPHSIMSPSGIALASGPDCGAEFSLERYSHLHPNDASSRLDSENPTVHQRHTMFLQLSARRMFIQG